MHWKCKIFLWCICDWMQISNACQGINDTTKIFISENLKHECEILGFFVFNDLHLYSVCFLTHSANDILEGRFLRDISDQLGLRQFATEPFHIWFTNVLDCTAKPCTATADHNGMLTNLKFKIPQTTSHECIFWYCNERNSKRLANTVKKMKL